MLPRHYRFLKYARKIEHKRWLESKIEKKQHFLSASATTHIAHSISNIKLPTISFKNELLFFYLSFHYKTEGIIFLLLFLQPNNQASFFYTDIIDPLFFSSILFNSFQLRHLPTCLIQNLTSSIPASQHLWTRYGLMLMLMFAVWYLSLPISILETNDEQTKKNVFLIWNTIRRYSSLELDPFFIFSFMHVGFF